MARLLLIDDDKSIREVLSDALVAAGHTVIQAADGRRVLACPDIDLVITDLIMPNCEGLEAIAALHRQRPSMPVIAISGAPANSKIYLRMAACLGPHRALPKPFSLAALLHLVDELLTPPLNLPPSP